MHTENPGIPLWASLFRGVVMALAKHRAVGEAEQVLPYSENLLLPLHRDPRSVGIFHPAAACHLDSVRPTAIFGITTIDEFLSRR